VQRFPRKVAVDASVFVSLISSRDPDHKACLQALRKLPDITAFVSTEACLTEVSWLLPNDRRFREQLLYLVRQLDLQIHCLDRTGLERVYELLNQYQDLPMDFADATLVATCERLNIEQVFTLDRKDFSIYRPSHTKAFKLAPDA
jgi:uncharacterized protein